MEFLVQFKSSSINVIYSLFIPLLLSLNEQGKFFNIRCTLSHLKALVKSKHLSIDALPIHDVFHLQAQIKYIEFQ